MQYLSILIGSIGLLLIIENRAIVSIIYFIIIILLLSFYILLSNFPSFLAYFLILIEIGAISILFGLILMIIGDKYKIKYPKLSLIISFLLLSSFFFLSNFFPLSSFSSFSFSIDISDISFYLTHFYHFSFLSSFLILLLIIFLPIFGLFFLLY